MTGWDWCKAVLDPELVGYYRVDGDKVTFTTKDGKRFVLAVADWADVEHGKKQVAAVMAGKVPPVVEPVALPTLEDVMVDSDLAAITEHHVAGTYAVQAAMDSAEVPTEGREVWMPETAYNKLVEKAPKKPRAKKSIQKQDVDLQSL